MSSLYKLSLIEEITKGSPNRLRESYFAKNNLKIYNDILEYTSNISDIRFPFKIWHWVNNEPEYIRCYCGNRVSENMNWKDGYKKYCSNKCSSNSEETKTKLKKTNLEKWGVDHYSKTEEWIEKVKKTSLEKWGVDNYSKTDDYIQKSKKTYLCKWGVENFTKTKEYLEKSKMTSLKNWGVEFPIQSETIKLKIKETNIKKYGTSHIFANDYYRNSNFNISSDENYISYKDGKNLFKCDCGLDHTFEIKTDDYYDRKKSNNSLCTICFTISDRQSIKEKMIFQFIKENYNDEIIENYRDGRMEIDIFIPNLKLGFEFNGIWWHSEKYKDKWYHRKKSEFFKKKGIKIIHIWEDDWINKQNIIKSQIKNLLELSTNKIFARKCFVKELKDVKFFLDQNHIQGAERSNIKLGLFFENEIVSVMTFNRSEGRKNLQKSEWNLSRFCNKLESNVVGGASKLLNYFISVYKPSRIVSYADKDWSNGNLYYKLGFKFLYETHPDYKYILNDRRVNKSRFRKSNLKGTGTESEQLAKLGLVKIWDCGKMKFQIDFNN